MFGIDNTGSALDTIAHVIQVALTPVFLLSGIATLLNVFSTRLARVADHVDAVSKVLEGADRGDAKRSRRGWREMPCRFRQRCSDDRVIVGCSAYRQSSSGNNVCR